MLGPHAEVCTGPREEPVLAGQGRENCRASGVSVREMVLVINFHQFKACFSGY